MSLLSHYAGQGIYIFWTKSDTSGITRTRISRSNTGPSGPWEELDIIDLPQTEYIDKAGTIESYYLLEELDATEPPVVLYTHPPMWGIEVLQSASLAYEMGEFTDLQIWRERIFLTEDRTKGFVQYKNWNLEPPPIFEVNAPQDELNQGKQQLSKTDPIFFTTENVTADYPSGLIYTLDYSRNIYFWDVSGNAVSIQPYDDVWATYTFPAFSNSELNNALKQSLAAIVAQPGVCKTTSLGRTPDWWDRALVAGAAGILLRRLIMKLMKPENIIPYSATQLGPEAVSNERQQIVGFLRDLAQQYWDEFKEAKELIKKAEYPGISIITTPEFMMPGGRSRFFRSLFKGGG